MLHGKRIWTIGEAANATELADKLANYDWCTCNGFRLGGYLFLNDSTGPDGAQEYAVVREKDGAQVESITFSWCDVKKALDYITEVIENKMTHVYATIDLKARIDTSPAHRCGACA